MSDRRAQPEKGHEELKKGDEELKKGHEEPKKPLYVLLLASPVLTALVTVGLGTIVGGYLLEKSKRNAIAAEEAKQKQEAVIKSQLTVLEAINAILAEYRIASEYLVFEVVDRRGEGLAGGTVLDDAINRYDAAAKAMLTGFLRELYRVRMYFQDEHLYASLKERGGRLSAVDGDLARLVIDYKKQGRNLSPEARRGWEDARAKLRGAAGEVEGVLNRLADATAAKN